MPITTFMSSGERAFWKLKRKELDKDFLEILEDTESITEQDFIITWVEFTTGLFRKKVKVQYSLLIPIGNHFGEVQEFNFSSPLKSSSINIGVSRETIMNYLFGYLNGFVRVKKNQEW